MKSNLGITAVPGGMSSCHYNQKSFVAVVSLFLLVSTLFIWHNSDSFSPRRWYGKLGYNRRPTAADRLRLVHGCDLFTGSWIPDATGPYYTNTSNCVIDDRQNCMKFGRPDTEFLKWRWKPNGCDLPLFNATQFLELVRGKSMAFIGDSLARNQMQSLSCLLSTVDVPMDAKEPDGRLNQWHFAGYNLTLAHFWSVHLVKSKASDTSYPSLTQELYLDEPDELWAARIENFHYVIFSAAQWFLRPMVYYQNGNVTSCFDCKKENITSQSMYYGYKMAFRTSFRTILDKFKGTVFLRTFSPSHFENGGWNTGGNCPRTRPIGKNETTPLGDYFLQLKLTQVAELEAAEKIGREMGLKFWIIDPTEMMSMRPDGHPNYYAPRDAKSPIADCTHWCLPGPIDTWNAILLQMLT